MIETIAHHYRSNISNRFTRGALSILPLDNATWNRIEEITEKSANYHYQGYHLDELYGIILSMAKFVAIARKEAAPALRYGKRVDNLSAQDRVFQDMVINNFEPNLNILADCINKLFLKIYEIDQQEAKGRQTVKDKIPELSELGRYLVG